MARTARNIITAAFRKAGIITKNESPSADEMNDALESLNDLMAGLSNDGLVVYARTEENFPLSSLVAEYTIGVGATFNTVRPINIAAAYVRSGTTDYSLDIITDETYAGIPSKDTTGTPYLINYTNNNPIANVRLFPAPSAGYTLYLFTEKPLTTFTLNTDVDLPPGWFRYLTNALAIEISPEYGVQVPQTTMMIAERALGDLRRARAKTKNLNVPVSGGYFNIYTGWTN